MNRFSQIPLYWKCQLVGWSLAALYWAYTGYGSQGFSWAFAAIHFFTDIILYIGLTHVYRCFALRMGWQYLNLKQLLPRLIPAAIVLGISYLFVTITKVYLIRGWWHGGHPMPYWSFFNGYRDSIFIAGIRLMSIWLLAYHLYHYSRREISIARENARLAIITRDAQLNNLSAQLNPHFLFNSLNSIKSLVSEDPALARRAVDLLSDLIRHSLYQGDEKLTSIRAELEMVRDYLELEMLRFEERLQYNIDVEPTAMEMSIPRLGIQTLVENAVKHGISKRKAGGLVGISINGHTNGIEISVTNPAVAEPLSAAAGVGLKNLNERLRLHFPGQSSFQLVQDGDLVRATIKIDTA